jgi:hypothetical protein
VPLPTPPTPTGTDLSVVLHHAGRALFGALAIAAELVVRGLAESAAKDPDDARRRMAATSDVADLVLAAGWRASHVSSDVLDRLVRITTPAVAVVLDPPLVPERFAPRRFMRRMTSSWTLERADAINAFTQLTQAVTPAAVVVVDDLVQPEELMVRAMERMDLDSVVTAAIADLDLDHVVAQVLEATDLDAAVAKIVERTDLESAISAGMESVDITAVVLEHLDVPRLVDAIMARIDTTKLVLDNVDIVTLAEAVIDGVDLPRIVRESSGSIASETVDTVRLQGMDADRAVARLVDRLLGRGRGQVDPT